MISSHTRGQEFLSKMRHASQHECELGQNNSLTNTPINPTVFAIVILNVQGSCHLFFIVFGLVYILPSLVLRLNSLILPELSFIQRKINLCLV